ncbi:MAG TPA: FAD-dependent oxidoreductase [Burkholderiales bacterium]|jgi:3-(3-hydroxy-phenyl)propionate hydroxylase|nr:FAD-dependent oxidoreductase [Burkholderiales bacterium]
MRADLFEYRKAPELRGQKRRYAVIVVGAGPVGLTAALDLAQRGIDFMLVDEDQRLSEGSRAICFAKRTLEILDRLGCGERAVAKGVVWNTGKVFLRERLLYTFDLLPEGGHKRPAFINLQQYYLEQFMIERLRDLGADLRWRNKVVALSARADGAAVTVDTPDGRYRADCDYLVVADGARSPVRHMLGLETRGQVFRDRFLITDVRMAADFPTERWFWFDPPFHPGQSVLLHRQADDVWRIDFQLGWNADPEAEKQPERVIPRIQAMLGPQRRFTLEWVSVYTFQCRRMERFRHGRVIFAGDAAHQVSPFGARGANSGMQDADNLVWKLDLVLRRRAPEALLDSYDQERTAAADENIRHSTRSTDFITPKSAVSRVFRDATLELARDHEFARRLVNSGRLSTPTTYRDSPLGTPDRDEFTSACGPGAPAIDAPLSAEGKPGWLIDRLGGEFLGLYFAGARPVAPAIAEGLRSIERLPVAVKPLVVCTVDAPQPPFAHCRDIHGLIAKRLDARPGTFYLFRPDQHVAGRWRHFEAAAVRGALARATAAHWASEGVAG